MACLRRFGCLALRLCRRYEGLFADATAAAAAGRLRLSLRLFADGCFRRLRLAVFWLPPTARRLRLAMYV